MLAGILGERQNEDTLLLSSEAFQNISDTTRLNAFIGSLGVTEVQVICYVREHLDYASSAFRQKIQNQAGFITFDDYCRQFGSMTSFIERWRDIGELELSWYDRSLLKQGDIICDFCHRAGIAAKDFRFEDKNPSIGGNLLSYKLAANHLGIPGGDYNSLKQFASDRVDFRAALLIDDTAAAQLRENSLYNRSLFAELGDLQLKSWSHITETPDISKLHDDYEFISGRLGAPFNSDHLQAMRDSAPWFRLETFNT